MVPPVVNPLDTDLDKEIKAKVVKSEVYSSIFPKTLD